MPSALETIFDNQVCYHLLSPPGSNSTGRYPYLLFGEKYVFSQSTNHPYLNGTSEFPFVFIFLCLKVVVMHGLMTGWVLDSK